MSSSLFLLLQDCSCCWTTERPTSSRQEALWSEEETGSGSGSGSGSGPGSGLDSPLPLIGPCSEGAESQSVDQWEQRSADSSLPPPLQRPGCSWVFPKVHLLSLLLCCGLFPGPDQDSAPESGPGPGLGLGLRPGPDLVSAGLCSRAVLAAETRCPPTEAASTDLGPKDWD